MVGRLFRNKHRPRVSLDLTVGQSHSVEALLQLRRSDWDWYRSNESAIEEELLELLEEYVLPRMFEKEVEDYHRKHNPQILPPDDSVVANVGVKNQKKNKQANNNKKQRKGSKAASKKVVVEVSEEGQKKEKDVYFAFGELLQLAYRKEELPAWNQAGKTLLFKGDGKEKGFQDRALLSARLLIWCSRVDPANPTNPDAENVGFYREEMIPIDSLFREPKDIK